MITVKGKVIDSSNGKAIQMANVTVTDSTGNYLPVNGVNVGRTTDASGAFIIPVANPDAWLTISYVGYKPLILPAEQAVKKSTFRLLTNTESIPDVEIKTAAYNPKYPGENSLGNDKKAWIAIFAIIGAAIIGGIIYTLKRKK